MESKNSNKNNNKTSNLYLLKTSENIIYCLTEEEVRNKNIPISKLILVQNRTDIEKCILSLENNISNNIGRDIMKDLLLFNANIRLENERVQNYDYSFSENLVSILEKIGKADSVTFFNNLELKEYENLKVKISNKGYNYIYDIISIISGINPISNKKLPWFDKLDSNDRYITIAMLIICMQVFSDANHRTATYLLKKYTNLSTEIIHNLIANMSNGRDICRPFYRIYSKHIKPTDFETISRLQDFYDSLPNIFQTVLKI